MKNGFLLLAVGGSLFVVWFFSDANGSKRPSVETTVCLISAYPERFNERSVVVSGHVGSDGIERVVLTDDSCERYGLAIQTPEHFTSETEFVKALHTGHPGTSDKTITGTFVGRFLWQPKTSPKRILVVREVHNLSIVMK